VQPGIDEGAGEDIVKGTEPAPRKFVRIGVGRHVAIPLSRSNRLQPSRRPTFDGVTLHLRDPGGCVEDTRASNPRTALKQQDDDILHGPP
jgi:hypothetical protein